MNDALVPVVSTSLWEREIEENMKSSFCDCKSEDSKRELNREVGTFSSWFAIQEMHHLVDLFTPRTPKPHQSPHHGCT